jgi:hypothetical protein
MNKFILAATLAVTCMFATSSAFARGHGGGGSRAHVSQRISSPPRARTEPVRTYTRHDGHVVQAYKRAPARR